jgi:hypothetical protein
MDEVDIYKRMQKRAHKKKNNIFFCVSFILVGWLSYNSVFSYSRRVQFESRQMQRLSWVKLFVPTLSPWNFSYKAAVSFQILYNSFFTNHRSILHSSILTAA